MTILLLDTSAAVKLVVPENGWNTMRRLWSQASTVAASQLLIPEFMSAIARRRRQGDLGNRIAPIITQWSELSARIARVNLDQNVAPIASSLVDRYPLSGADAVHLASALALDLDDAIFATWDERLHTAARAEGLAVAPRDPAAVEP